MAILGAGRIAGGYDSQRLAGDRGVYTHAGAYAGDGRFRLATVCDTAPDRAAAFGNEWGADAWTTEPEEVYSGFHDVVSVCTPDASHFSVIRELLVRRACRTILAEKPLALTDGETEILAALSREQKINLVVNFQRRFDPVHGRVKALVHESGGPLAVNCYYIKGLDHIGVTMIDTLSHLLGRPRRVLGYNRVTSQIPGDETCEFVLFFDSFNATVKTVDRGDGAYHYHIFEIDLLLPTCRLILNDNSRTLETRKFGDYAYGGVSVLDDAHPRREQTGYSRAMLGCIDYLYGITAQGQPHTINTAEEYRRTRAVVDAVRLSCERGAPQEIES